MPTTRHRRVRSRSGASLTPDDFEYLTWMKLDGSKTTLDSDPAAAEAAYLRHRDRILAAPTYSRWPGWRPWSYYVFELKVKPMSSLREERRFLRDRKLLRPDEVEALARMECEAREKGQPGPYDELKGGSYAYD